MLSVPLFDDDVAGKGGTLVVLSSEPWSASSVSAACCRFEGVGWGGGENAVKHMPYSLYHKSWLFTLDGKFNKPFCGHTSDLRRAARFAVLEGNGRVGLGVLRTMSTVGDRFGRSPACRLASAALVRDDVVSEQSCLVGVVHGLVAADVVAGLPSWKKTMRQPECTRCFRETVSPSCAQVLFRRPCSSNRRPSMPSIVLRLAGVKFDFFNVDFADAPQPCRQLPPSATASTKGMRFRTAILLSFDVLSSKPRPAPLRAHNQIALPCAPHPRRPRVS